jgi:hypothetical protein
VSDWEIALLVLSAIFGLLFGAVLLLKRQERFRRAWNRGEFR